MGHIILVMILAVLDTDNSIREDRHKQQPFDTPAGAFIIIPAISHNEYVPYYDRPPPQSHQEVGVVVYLQCGGDSTTWAPSYVTLTKPMRLSATAMRICTRNVGNAIVIGIVVESYDWTLSNDIDDNVIWYSRPRTPTVLDHDDRRTGRL
jgi:hypothetical protein